MKYEEMIDAVIHAADQCSSERCIVAVDGRCASGKSEFGRRLSEKCGGQLLHMDDYFLQPEQRTAERYETPGENVDHERFEAEVMKPLSEGRSFLYRPFDCKSMTLTEGKMVEPGDIVIVEGSYSMHLELLDYYDLKVFLTVNPVKQIERIRKRNPDKIEDFEKKWIPLEELYFDRMRPEERADFIFDTSMLF